MRKITFLTATLFLTAYGVQAQDTHTDSHTIGITVPQVALVDIEPAASKNITMDFTAPTEAGLPITAPTNNSTLWLNYSFIPSATGITGSVNVGIGTAVPGIDVKVAAAAPTGSGGGTLGTTLAASAMTLTAAPQDIITGIGASYTGDGNSNGHNLTYSLDSSANYGDLFATTATVTVTYTITE